MDHRQLDDWRIIAAAKKITRANPRVITDAELSEDYSNVGIAIFIELYKGNRLLYLLPIT